MYRFFLSKRYVNLFFTMQKEKNIHQLSRKVDMTSAHLSIVTDQLEKEGLIIKNRKGREVSIEITDLGKQFNEILLDFDALANKLKSNKKED